MWIRSWKKLAMSIGIRTQPCDAALSGTPSGPNVLVGLGSPCMANAPFGVKTTGFHMDPSEPVTQPAANQRARYLPSGVTQPLPSGRLKAAVDTWLISTIFLCLYSTSTPTFLLISIRLQVALRSSTLGSFGCCSCHCIVLPTMSGCLGSALPVLTSLKAQTASIGSQPK